MVIIEEVLDEEGPEAEVPLYRAGMRVRLVGLLQKTELNGKCGVVSAWNKTTQRCQVRFAALLPTNRCCVDSCLTLSTVSFS